MTWAEAWDAIGKIATLLGGLGVVVIGLSGWLAKMVTDWTIEGHKSKLVQEVEKLKGELAKETESHKLLLKRHELLFMKEMDAASAFIALHREVEPKRRHPDMDWDEAMEDVADDFSRTEIKLRNYVSEYGAALSPDNRGQIDKCMLIASNNQYAKHESDQAVDEAKKAAEDMLNQMKEIEARFLSELRRQVI